jgi:hypothetical protein
MNTNLKAKRVGNYVRKDGDHQGKTFYIYEISGPKDELEKFVKSPSQKKWPRKNKLTGAPQIHTMYMDPLRKENPLYEKQDGNYTLDKSETRDDLGVLSALRNEAPELVESFTNNLAERCWGSGKTSSSTASLILGTEPQTEPSKGADLSSVE